jgi:hypothetical protein
MKLTISGRWLATLYHACNHLPHNFHSAYEHLIHDESEDSCANKVDYRAENS